MSLFRLLHLFLSRACKTDIYLFPKVKYDGMYDLLNLEITCYSDKYILIARDRTAYFGTLSEPKLCFGLIYCFTSQSTAIVMWGR